MTTEAPFYEVQYDADDQLKKIRQQMVEALRETPPNKAEYHRLGDEHRRILHAAYPDKKAAWERCCDLERAKERTKRKRNVAS